jgi:hypothetical protein
MRQFILLYVVFYILCGIFFVFTWYVNLFIISSISFYLILCGRLFYLCGILIHFTWFFISLDVFLFFKPKVVFISNVVFHFI